MVLERYFQNIYFDNFGISYSSGTFTIRGSNGSNLSPSNPGIIFMPSKTNPGSSVRYKITSNQSFIDDAGSSEIIGNLFGLTTGVAYGQDLPFYIYAVSNDDQNTIQFMISRIPHAKNSPSAASIGAPDDPVADTDTSFWSLDNIDETLYDQNPCICIGSFRMQMSASDDWTVQTLDNFDGINQFQETREFTTVAGHFGAASSKFFKDNGGTAPSFSTNLITYFISKDGFLILSCNFTGATAGVGNVDAFFSSPITAKSVNSGRAGSSRFFDSSAGQFSTGICSAVPSTTSVSFIFPVQDPGGSLENNDIGTSDQILFSIEYPMSF